MTKEQAVPWYQAPKIDWEGDAHSIETALEAPLYDFIIVGAGIAGATAAYELTNAGFRILLLEAEGEVATQGSGNLQGMLYLKLSPHTPVQNELLISGLHYVRALLQQLTEQSLLTRGIDWDDCGLIQLARSPKEQEKQQRLAQQYPDSLLQWVDHEQATQLAGVSVTAGGLYFPTSGWVSPPAFVSALLNSAAVEPLCHKRVIEICQESQGESTPLWHVHCEDGTHFWSKGVILAMAEGVAQLDPCCHLPFTVVRGQTTTIEQDNPLKMVISGEGYIAPAKGGMIKKSTFGATFRRHQPGGYLTEEEHRENIAMLTKSSPQLAALFGLDEEMEKEALEAKALDGRAATRASAMGSMPIVGPIANRSHFMEDFAAIRADAKAVPDRPVPWERGLYLTTAHGSRGMISAPIGAALLREYIVGVPEERAQYTLTSLSDALKSALHPNRFYYHALRFNQSLEGESS